MSVTLSNAKNKLIDDIAEGQNFTDYRVEVKSGSMKGDGYLGIVNVIHIQEIEEPKNELNLVIKSAMTEEEIRETAPVRKAYEREIFMYERVFPEIRKFSDEVGIMNKFTETAKCYGSLLAQREECLVLQDLRKIDFRLWNRKKPMNAEHVALVFSTYGKLHATGLALKILDPEKSEHLHKNLINIFYKDGESEEEIMKLRENFDQIFANGFKAVADNERATKALERFVQDYEKLFREDVRKFDKYTTILHGDCWCNNMMFRYKDPTDPSLPTEVCLLDWQIAHIGSPILDLSYFFYACSSREVLYDLKKFLRIYHNTVVKTLREAGLNPEEVLTFEELEHQWKLYSGYGLLMALLVMKIILIDSGEAPDLSQLAKSGKSILEAIISSNATNMEVINTRITHIIEFMDDFGFL